MDFITQLLVYCHKNNGGTFDVREGVEAVCEPSVGYWVSKDGGEEVDLLTADAVEQFIEKHNLRERNKLGIWKDEESGKWCLDVTRFIPNKERAIRFGRNENQKAIWDCAAGKEIRL